MQRQPARTGFVTYTPQTKITCNFYFISYFLFKKRPQEAEGTEGAMETKIKEDYVEDSQPARAS